MKKICICNQKGGVGKTTTAVNLSAYLASMGRKTLLIDMDPQSATTSGIGIDKSKLDRTIYDVLLGECSIKDVIIKTQVENLDIVPSNMDLAGAEVELSVKLIQDTIFYLCQYCFRGQ